MHFRKVPAALEEFQFEDFELRGYDPHPAIPAPVAV
jgi:thymidylate synthase